MELNFFRTDLRNIILPKDKMLFQKIANKSLLLAKLPKQDFSNYDWNGVAISGAEFHPESILPKDKFFLQNIRSKSLYATVMPEMDMANLDDEYFRRFYHRYIQFKK